MTQLRLRWLWITWGRDVGLVVWLCIGGRRPLAHLPRWRRWLHGPVIRWRLCPVFP